MSEKSGQKQTKHKVKPKSRARKVLIKVILIICIFIILPLVITELFLIFFHPIEYLKPVRIPKGDDFNNLIHKASPIKGLDYELNPNAEKDFNNIRYKINSYGMRDDEPLENSDKSIIRIAVLGDSFAMGYFEKQENIFPIVLEKMLNDAFKDEGQKFDVLNFGVDGYSTRQESLVLTHKALEFNPDLIIVGYVLNDPENDPVIPEVSRVYHKTFWWQHFHMFRALYVAMVQYQMKKYGNGDYLRYLHNKNFYKWESVEKGLKDIRITAEAKGLKVILAMFPVIVENTWKDYQYKDLHKQIEEEAKKNGFYYTDILDAWSKVEPGSKLWTSPQDRHPNKIGHYLIADILKKIILAEKDKFFKKKN